jgi:hypothetical protein
MCPLTTRPIRRLDHWIVAKLVDLIVDVYYLYLGLLLKLLILFMIFLFRFFVLLNFFVFVFGLICLNDHFGLGDGWLSLCELLRLHSSPVRYTKRFD